MTVEMALFDFVPVTLFAAAAILQQTYFFSRMGKGQFALFSGGTIMIIVGGLFKSSWKLLYALSVCDFQRLNMAFFPMQATGFLMAGIAMDCFLLFRKKEVCLSAAVPPLFSGTVLFVPAMVFGTFSLCLGLSVEAARCGRKVLRILFAMAFLFLLAMGYLSAKDFTDPMMNWLGQGVNTAGQACLLAGTILLVQKDF